LKLLHILLKLVNSHSFHQTTESKQGKNYSFYLSNCCLFELIQFTISCRPNAIQPLQTHELVRYWLRQFHLQYLTYSLSIHYISPFLGVLQCFSKPLSPKRIGPSRKFSDFTN